MVDTKNMAIEAIIRDSIDVRKLGLTFLATEHSTPLGRIDILAEDESGNNIPIEIKIGSAGDSAIGQILGYMKALGVDHGIIMANEFSERVKAIAPSLGIKLYPFRFDVIISGESVVLTDDEISRISDTESDRVQKFIEACCGKGGFIEPRTFHHAYTRWHKETYGAPPEEDMMDITKHRTRHGFGKEARKAGRNSYLWDDRNSIKCYTGIHLNNTSGNLSVYPDYVDTHWHEITGHP